MSPSWSTETRSLSTSSSNITFLRRSGSSY